MQSNLKSLWYHKLFSVKQTLVYQFVLGLFFGILFLVYWIISPILFLIQVFFAFLCYAARFLPKSNITNTSTSLIQPKRLTIFLDLDNTLVYASRKPIDNITQYTLLDGKFYLYKRPYLDTFLSTLSQFSDLIIYTASIKAYADKIINLIDENNFISARYYRSDCTFFTNCWYKDVSKYFNDKRSLLIIDDQPNSHLKMKENIIHIKSWDGKNKGDDSLLKIKNIINTFHGCGKLDIEKIVESSERSEV